VGIVSLSDLDKLFWAGRYCERARGIYERYVALPSDGGVRLDFLARLGIDCNDSSPHIALFGGDGAIVNALRMWRENVLCLRYVLSCRAVIQAEKAVTECEEGNFDNLVLRSYAFFGMTEDLTFDNTARCCVTAGRMCEKLDLLSRFCEDTFAAQDALNRLSAACADSPAVQNMISQSALQLIDGDIRSNNVVTVKSRTPYLESNNEFS
jgi:hypothetical protein